MSNDVNHKVYELLHKMRGAQLDDAEMALLRSLCHEDPFLADALDGLLLLNQKDRSTHINHIEKYLKNLLEKNKKRSQLPVVLRRIAAVGVVIIGIWAVWRAFPDQKTPIAMQAERNDREKILEPEADVLKPQTEASNPDEVKDLAAQPATANNDIEETPSTQSITGVKAEKENLSEPPDQTAQNATDQKESRQTPNSTTAMAAEEPTKRNPDKDEKPQMPRTNNGPPDSEDANPGLKPENRGLTRSKIVDDSMKKPTNLKNQAPRQVSYALASPINGWNSYYKYIRNKLKTPSAAQDASIEGSVVLEFDLDSDGSPTKFRVIQSLGYGCDEEAIRLISEGPKWDVANAQVPIGRLTIDF